jgi:hypothetical protein
MGSCLRTIFERLMSSLQEVQTALDRAKDKASPKLMIVK